MSNAPPDLRDISSDFWITSNVSALTRTACLPAALLMRTTSLSGSPGRSQSVIRISMRRTSSYPAANARSAFRSSAVHADRMISVPIAPYFGGDDPGLGGCRGRRRWRGRLRYHCHEGDEPQKHSARP